jgi:hypothetical protein
MEEGKETSSSTTMMEPWSLFIYGMKAPLARVNIEEG